MIQDYGWSAALQQQFHDHAAAGLVPARVTAQHRGQYRVASDAGDMSADISGRFAFEAADGDYPVTGDWVAIALPQGDGMARIQAVLPRQTCFVRRAAGPETRPQVIAANVDIALLTASLNADFNIRRLERYLSLTHDSGARAVIVLTKADLCPDPEAMIHEVETIAPGVPVLAVSALSGQGLEAVRVHLGPRRTAVLLGSSGAGKSTLVNALMGHDVMATQAIRGSDARGRHTTTHRELVALPDGSLLLDTPGMRELALWDSSGVSETFADIEALALSCRFRDCSHEREPGCAVQDAMQRGALSPDRWQSFGKLQRELAHLDRKEDPLARAAHRKVWIGRHKAYRAQQRLRERDE